MTTLKDFYVDLVTPEHKLKPKFISFLELLLSYSDDVYNLTIVLDEDFDIDNAVGKQLDVLGDIIGVKRNNVLQGTLDDELYRLVLMANICKNYWNGSFETIYEIWESVFPDIGISIIDNMDMTMDVTVVGVDDPKLKELILAGYIVPKPAGVNINYNVSSHPLFGYDVETELLAGYDVGYWSDSE